MRLKKSQFADSLAFERATAKDLYARSESIDPKYTGLCLRDQVASHGGESTSSTEGGCQLSEECIYSDDKIQGVTGLCLMATVGIAKPSK